jgi:hypothetical protein
MKYFVSSDLHIEKVYPKVPKASEVFKGVDITNTRLILNGDVGRLVGDKKHMYWEQYVSFIAGCCSQFEYVFLVLGNHEYYTDDDGPSMEELIEKVRTLENLHSNFKVLDNSCAVLSPERLVIFGSTFWSYYPDNTNFPSVPINLLDGRRITAASWNLLHFAAKSALEHAIHRAKQLGYKLMVVTHHAPTFTNTLDEKYKDAGTSNNMYCSTCDEYLSDKLITVWVYGHTAHNTQYRHDNGTFVYSNQYNKPGYSTESISVGQFEMVEYT